jgi:hypothetical protein
MVWGRADTGMPGVGDTKGVSEGCLKEGNTVMPGRYKVVSERVVSGEEWDVTG